MAGLDFKSLNSSSWLQLGCLLRPAHQGLLIEARSLRPAHRGPLIEARSLRPAHRGPPSEARQV